VDSPEALTLARTAKTFSFRPSRAFRITDPAVALDFDQALAHRLLFDEARAAAEARSGRQGELPPGMRYETEAEILQAARVH
jgi:hypothetical protein